MREERESKREGERVRDAETGRRKRRIMSRKHGRDDAADHIPCLLYSSELF
jgi:hypothetical protein